MDSNNTKPVTREELQAQIEALKAQNLELLKEERATFRMKVSEKGAISVYGFGRFPVTLYKEQMETLIKHVPDIQKFIAEHVGQLKTRQTKAS